jgi:hypothetical protein
MTTAIQQPSTINFIQEIFFQPYAEGAERVSRAIEGVNLHHIEHPKLNCSTIIWNVFVGVLLMTPLINSIIWICMKTFGNPDRLSDPFSVSSQTEEPQVPDLENPVSLPIVGEVPTDRTEPLSANKVKYKDVLQDVHLDAEWKFETHEDIHHVTRTDRISRSEMSFDLDWNQKTLRMLSPTKDVRVERRGNILSVQGTIEGKPIDRDLKIPNYLYPWIQEPIRGFQSFVLSDKAKLQFYGIHPKELYICECIAEKEEVQLAPFGKVIKVTLKINEGWKGFVGMDFGHCWFDRENGDLLKLQFRVGAFSWGESNLVRDNT